MKNEEYVVVRDPQQDENLRAAAADLFARHPVPVWANPEKADLIGELGDGAEINADVSDEDLEAKIDE